MQLLRPVAVAVVVAVQTLLLALRVARVAVQQEL
jgi:hypothetical protein